MPRLGLLLQVSSLAGAFLAGPTVWADTPGDELFEKEVRPLLVEHCLKCHGNIKPKGSLRLTSRTAILKGGDTGPAAVAGKPDDSLLIQAVRYNDTPQMPPRRKLTDRQIAVLTRWVKLGLSWPETASNPTVAGGQSEFHITEEQLKKRCWQSTTKEFSSTPSRRSFIRRYLTQRSSL